MNELKYPIFIPSRGRWKNNLTANLLKRDCVPFTLVVEKNEYSHYKQEYGKESVICLPGSDYGCVSVARNFIKDFCLDNKHKKHWQIDDDIRGFMQVNGKITITEDTRSVLTQVEGFSDKYSNIAIAGLGSNVFGRLQKKPYIINRFAYTCMLIQTDIPVRYKRYTEDDLQFNLECLTLGYCTVQFNCFLFKWSTTETRSGGYTDLYAGGKRLERQKNTMKNWPGLLTKLTPKKNGYRIVTNHVWKRFKQAPIPL